MSKPSKRTKKNQELVDSTKHYNIKEAVELLKGAPHSKFDETIEMAFKINVDLKKGPQSIRGTAALPHGTGKSVRVLVFCKSDKAKQAQEAGADNAGDKELIDKVAGGWMDFDVAVATPDMMKDVARLGKVLGPRGMMPSPKAGTVTDDIAKAVKEVKAGKIEFKMDKQGNILAPIGKISFDHDKICDNVKYLINAVIKAKTGPVKGEFIKSVALSSTHGPGIRLDTSKWKT